MCVSLCDESTWSLLVSMRMSDKFMATISLPGDVRRAWREIPNKSLFVAQSIRSLYGTSDREHLAFREKVGMCIPYGKGENCQVCIGDLNMTSDELKVEWHVRNRTPLDHVTPMIEMEMRRREVLERSLDEEE